MVYFLTHSILDNYRNKSAPYIYSENESSIFNRGRNLEALEINYPFWILYNNGISNIKLITSCEDITDSDVVVFYNCNDNRIADLLDFSRDYIKIQIVTDQPIIEGCSSYICYDESVVYKDTSRLWHHVMYPLPIGLKKCNPSWPPKQISCISPDKITIDNSIYNTYNIIDNSYVNRGDEDILFHIRAPVTFNPHVGLSTRMKFPSHKTANRLYQSWYCNVPSILSSNPAMEFIRESELDFLRASNVDELHVCVNELQHDKDLFYSMIDNCKRRADENCYSVIVDQWLRIFEYYEAKY